MHGPTRIFWANLTTFSFQTKRLKMLERKGLRGAALRNALAQDAAEHGVELRGEGRMNTGKNAPIGNRTAVIKIGKVKRHVSIAM